MLFLVNGPILFGTVLIHELGHCWATYRCQARSRASCCASEDSRSSATGRGEEDTFVCVAGPLTHIRR